MSRVKQKRIDETTILTAAIELAEKSSWEKLRLYQVADHLNITLSDIQRYYCEKEEIADAWLEQADVIMLNCAKQKDFHKLSTHDRLHTLIMAWLETFALHQNVTRQILYGKLEPGHLHVTFPALLRVSRTVQWIREAAQRNAHSVKRAIEETALTTIFLLTLTKWLYDESKDREKTNEFLHALLNKSSHANNLFQNAIDFICERKCK